MLNPSIMDMIGPKILVLRGHTTKVQFRFPKSKRRRIKKKWAARPGNFREIYVPPPIRDDEYLIMNEQDIGTRIAFDPWRKDASQYTAGPQTILCTPAGEDRLRKSLWLSLKRQKGTNHDKLQR